MFSSINRFELNRNGVSTNQDFMSLIELLAQIRDFLNELGYLAYNFIFVLGGVNKTIAYNVI